MLARDSRSTDGGAHPWRPRGSPAAVGVGTSGSGAGAGGPGIVAGRMDLSDRDDPSRDGWERAPSDLVLDAGAVHVWRARLDLADGILERLRRCLRPDEHEREARFRRPELRARFAAARGTLRLLLGRYLGAPPRDLAIDSDENGKPRLLGAGDLRFNVSHSRDRALLAFAREIEVGVDIEAIDERASREQIAERFFAPEEVAALGALPLERRSAGFFACWTRKEAYLKGLGTGLQRRLASFAVTVDPDATAISVVDDESPEAQRTWTLVDLAPGDGFAGCVAAEARQVVVRRFEADAVSVMGA